MAEEFGQPNGGEPDAANASVLPRSLAHRTFGSIAWMMSGSVVQAALRVAVLVILARLLTPIQFGIASAAIVVVNFTQILSYIGMGPALVQRKELTPRHISTGFTLSLLLGVSLAAVTWAASPFVAGFFRVPELVPVLRVILLVFPLRGLSIVAESLLRRQLKFRLIASSAVVSYAVGYGVVGVVLAVLGAGVWALVAAFLAQTAMVSALELVLQPHPKRLGIHGGSARDLMSFGGGMTLVAVLNYAALQGDSVVAGRWLGTAALGIYNRAYNLMATGASLFGGVLDEVIFPALSRIQEQRDRLAQAYRRGITLVTLVLLPVSIFLFITAPELITLLLGPAWTDTIRPFQFLSLGILLRTSYKIGASLIKAKGLILQQAWRHAVYAAAVFGGAWLGQRLGGVSGLALGVLAALILNYVLVAQIVGRITNFTTAEFLRAHFPGLVLGAVVGSSAEITVTVLRNAPANPAVTFLAAGMVSVAVATASCAMVPRLFLGADGLWMLHILSEHLPDRAAFKGVRRRLERVVSSG